MRPVWLQVAQLLLVVGVVGSLLRASLPRGRATAAAWSRRRAEWLPVGFALLIASLLIVVLRALTSAGGVDPLGLLPFLVLAATVAVAAPLLRSAWSRARAEAAAEREAASAPTAEPVRRHRGLGGEETPPARW